MAPPPPASLPTSQRLMALAQTLQFAWFAGHVTLLLCVLRYGLSYLTFNYYSTWAKLTYRTAFLSAVATYGIVVYKAARARARSGRADPNANGLSHFLAMASDENVQYLLMAIVWFLSRQMPLAILPFAVYSVFHVANYTRSNLLPTLQPPPQTAGGNRPAPSPLSESIGKFVNEYHDRSMVLVATLEILLWFRVLGSAILFQRGSWILLIVYTAFFRVRHSQCRFVQNAVSQATARADGVLSNQSIPPVVRNLWEQVKAVVRQAADATDVNRFSPRPAPAGQKKAS